MPPASHGAAPPPTVPAHPPAGAHAGHAGHATRVRHAHSRAAAWYAPGAGRAPRRGIAEEGAEVAEIARLSPEEALARLNARLEGLSARQVAARRARHGPNVVTREAPPSLARELWARARNPLNALLLALAALSWLLGDARAAAVVGVIVVLATATSFVQAHRSSTAAARLRSMVRNACSVRRRDAAGGAFAEVPIESLVPGDIVRLAAGDMVPADLRLLEAKDLFVNQSALTGESMPAEKFAHADARPDGADAGHPFDLPNLAYMGANVVSGYGTGVVLRTGGGTFFGALADEVVKDRQPTAFERGVDRFTWMMIRVMAVMVPLVFVINGLTKHDWLQALLFAVAVAVGLTPEMLPMIVTVNLARGALKMASAKVIVKRLEAIQDLGAMDVLCTDKTGTLTQDRILLKRHLDLDGRESDRVLQYAWLNSHFQSGLKNLLDVAVLEHVELHQALAIEQGWTRVDEVPFDFHRRRLSVVVRSPEGRHVLICKGAVEEMFAVSTRYETGGRIEPLAGAHFEDAQRRTRDLNEDGFRVVAVGWREFDAPQAAYAADDEHDLVLLGCIAFLDPPKDSAREALAALAGRGVDVKILTGDNDVVTRKVCRDVGLEPGEILLGAGLDAMDDAALGEALRNTRVMAKLTPAQKERVVLALRARGHVVGFLGDGINDSPALKAADVGLSVDTAVDIARESADIILLEKSLLVLREGVLEGRRVFANVTKYIRMGASSNFGNMFSVLGASLFLPFLPMTPVQVLTNNLLYDLSQSAIPTDRVDDEDVARPRRWDIGGLFRFMLALGPVSSLFDYATFFLLLRVFGAWDDPALFQTGWFVESLLTQTLVIHVIRTARVPFVQSRASAALGATTLLVCAAGLALPYTGLGRLLGFRPLPAAWWPMLAGLLAGYAVLAHLAKARFVRRWGM